MKIEEALIIFNTGLNYNNPAEVELYKMAHTIIHRDKERLCLEHEVIQKTKNLNKINMDKQSNFKFGQKVSYIDQGSEKIPQNGIVKSKSFDDVGLFVVFKCNNDWGNIINYTGEYCLPQCLSDGWVKEKGRMEFFAGGYLENQEKNTSAEIHYARVMKLMAEYNQYKCIKVVEDLWWFGYEDAARRIIDEYGTFDMNVTIFQLGHFASDFKEWFYDNYESEK